MFFKEWGVHLDFGAIFKKKLNIILTEKIKPRNESCSMANTVFPGP
jgi:hypothetical protein